MVKNTIQEQKQFRAVIHDRISSDLVQAPQKLSYSTDPRSLVITPKNPWEQKKRTPHSPLGTKVYLRIRWSDNARFIYEIMHTISLSVQKFVFARYWILGCENNAICGIDF